MHSLILCELFRLEWTDGGVSEIVLIAIYHEITNKHYIPLKFDFY